MADAEQLIPVECFLHRIFPAGIYSESGQEIIERRLFKPRKDCPDFELKTPVAWEATDRKTDRNWRMQLQGWTVFQPVMNFFDALESKQDAVDFFFDIARDWWENYGADADDIVTSRMPDSYAWYDMSVGFRALIIAFFKNRLDAFNITVSAEDSQLLLQLAKKHIANLSCEETFSLNNHGVFQAQGLMALLMTFSELPQRDEQVAYALSLMERLVASQYDDNGIHMEHSPHYHFYVLATFEAIVKSGWFDNSSQINERVTKARDARKWIVDPLKRPVCIGDSILTVQKSVEFPDEGNLPVFSDFDTSGYQVLRSGWATPAERASMVFLMGAYHTKTHKHRDCLSFEWFDNGARIVCDSGKYGYKSDKYRHYCLSNKAHNTVEIEGFDLLKIAPYGSAILPADALPDGVYRLNAKLDYPAIKFARSIYVKPGAWLIVEDDLNFARARNATQWFHLESDFAVVSSANNSLKMEGENERQLQIECLSDDVTSLLHKGDEEIMQGFVSHNDYHIVPAIAVGFKVHTAATKLVTVLSLSDTARIDAMKFAAETLSNSKAALILPADDAEKKNILPNIPHHAIKSDSKVRLLPGANTYSASQNDVPITFFADIKGRDKKKLLIMLPGASARANGHIDLQRYTWSSDFPDHDVIAFSDPTLRPSNDIGLAWFQYHKNNYGLAAISALLRRILKDGDYALGDVNFFGSSGGGFGVLQLADEFPQSQIIAINPQIYLYNYMAEFYEKMLATCYPGMSHAAVFREFKNRIAVQIDFKKRKSGIFVFQNSFDSRHMNKHLRPFMKNLDQDLISEIKQGTNGLLPDKLFNVIVFDDEASGHSPPSRPVTVKMIERILK